MGVYEILRQQWPDLKAIATTPKLYSVVLPSMDFLSEPWFWVIVGAASELIGMSPLKSNSVVQLLLSGLRAMKPKK